jgi:hypothetical protein
MDNEDKKRGFSGLSDLTSEVTIVDEVIEPKSISKPKLYPLNNSTKAQKKESSIADTGKKVKGFKSLFSTAEIIGPNLFVGQQFIYSLKFFTSVRLANLRFETPPDFKGCVSKFIKEKNKKLDVNGTFYNRTELVYSVIAENPGSFIINPVVLIAGVVVKSSLTPKLVRIVSNLVKFQIR